MAEWRLGSVNSWNVKTQATVLYPWPDVNVHPVDGAGGPSANAGDADQEVSEDEEGECSTHSPSASLRHLHVAENEVESKVVHTFLKALEALLATR